MLQSSKNYAIARTVNKKDKCYLIGECLPYPFVLVCLLIEFIIFPIGFLIGLLLLYIFGYGAAKNGNEDKDDLLQTACDILEQNLDCEISMEKLAKDIQMGYESFRKEFRKKYGISPRRYRIEKKMEQACMLLESGIPIKEIAQMVGYEDVYSFSKQFTKTYHIAPGKFRQRKND